MFKGQASEDSSLKIDLPVQSAREHVILDYSTTALSLKAHPVSFAREELNKMKVVPAGKLPEIKNGKFVKVCGLITVRQRPGTAKGVLFITIEDETGFANLVVWNTVFEKYRPIILQSKLLMVTGKVQVEGEVVHVVVNSCHNLTGLMQLDTEGRDIGSVEKPIVYNRPTTTDKPVQGELFPSRDFK